MAFTRYLKGLVLAAVFAVVVGLGFATGVQAKSHDPGVCIRCEAYGNAESCRRCLDTPSSTKATVPAQCKAAATACKVRLDGECKILGNPMQFLSCLKEEKTCATAVEKCETLK